MHSYEPKVFDQIGPIEVAGEKADTFEAGDFVNTVLKQLLIQHQLNDKLGISLCHRHFDLRPDEILVEHGGVATAWASDAESRYAKIGSILPLSWVVWEGKLRPYEFYFSHDTSEEPFEIPPNFLEAFDSALRGKGLNHLLGLRLLRTNGEGLPTKTVELKERHATFSIPWTSAKLDSGGDIKFIRAMWGFPSLGEQCEAVCAHYC
jgi:hypothetical protein